MKQNLCLDERLVPIKGTRASALGCYFADRYSTLAGLILWRLGHIPAQGETFTFDGRSYEVVSLDGRNIDKVLIRTATSATVEPA